jgi:S-disulfanyl-L-cysteine oxidoreductase SoxD
MKTRSAAIVLAAACVMGAAPSVVRAAAQGAAKTTWDGVYADAQAQKGEAIYGAKCVECHGPEGSGGNGPVLNGAGFGTEWDGVALSDLFDRTRLTAPASNPGSLNRDEVAALMAYLLKLNGFPPGPSDLPNSGELLKPIKYVSANPNR